MNTEIEYLLHLADNALILGQRNAEWCGHGPILEEDIAMANIGLDHIGQARLLYQHVAALMADGSTGGATEDSLAYFRGPEEFRNYVLLELPHHTAMAPSAAVERDYAVTIVRNFLYSSLMVRVWDALQNAADAQLAAIAAKSLKEVRYHLRHSTDWMLRLGDGTALSKAKMQAALDFLMPYTQEFWLPAAMDKTAKIKIKNAPESEAVCVCFTDVLSTISQEWKASVDAVILKAQLQAASVQGHLTRGKEGVHSEHLSYLLAEMQSLARAHPQAVW